MHGLKERFGRAVRELRLGRELSQEKLAQKAKLSRNFLGSLERGESSVSLEAADRIARGLGTTLTELIGLTESERTTTQRGSLRSPRARGGYSRGDRT